MTRSLGLVYIASFGAMTSFYLMLGITPLYALEHGYGAFSASITTTIFMVATVVAELATNLVMRRIGQQATLAVGVLLLALPAFVLVLSSDLSVILVVSAVRGVGFALVIIAGAAMVASLADPAKQGEAMGVFGVVVGIPGIIGLPFGVWLVEHIGFAPLFIISGSAAAVGLVVVVLRIHLPRPDEIHGLLRTLRTGEVLGLAIVFLATTVSAGVFITWLPVAAGERFGSTLAAVGLLAYGLAGTLTRWLAGRFGDRRNARVLILPALVLITASLGFTAFVPQLLIVGALLFGAGFGALQNVVLQLMFRRVGPSGYGSASAIWNVAFDLGLGVGAFLFGALSAGFALALWVAGLIVGVTALIIAAQIASRALSRRDGSSASSQQTPG